MFEQLFVGGFLFTQKNSVGAGGVPVITLIESVVLPVQLETVKLNELWPLCKLLTFLLPVFVWSPRVVGVIEDKLLNPPGPVAVTELFVTCVYSYLIVVLPPSGNTNGGFKFVAVRSNVGFKQPKGPRSYSHW